MDLSKVVVRQKLKPRREPYWARFSPGRFIGFRPSKAGGAGTFICKFHEPDSARVIHTLGGFGQLPPNERYAEAKKAAETWFDHVQSGGSSKPVTVGEVCKRYAATRPEAAARFKLHVYDEPLAKAAIHRLKKADLTKWREWLAAKPARVTRRKNGKQITRPRSAGDINRNVTALRAALNMAKDEGLTVTDTAWSTVLRPIPNADRRRNLYLDRKQRQALLKYLPDDAMPFVRSLCMLPLRPGAIAQLIAGDFDSRRSELTISKDKAGQARKLLLPTQIAALLKEQSRGKLPAAPLFTRANGAAWNKATWRLPIRDAAQAAGLPAATTAYTLRHSTITDLVTGGLDLLTTAQVAGTSVQMVQAHYGHLQQHLAADALAGLALPA